MRLNRSFQLIPSIMLVMTLAQSHAFAQENPEAGGANRCQEALAANAALNDDWAGALSRLASRKLHEATHRNDAAPGVVIASPSRANPDYYYHWTRDAALTMATIHRQYLVETNPDAKRSLRNTLMDFSRLSRGHQQTPTRGGMGEPKFHVDGRAYDEDWGRPQNDGPALRAITLIEFARTLLREGEGELVRSFFYDGKIPTASVIKADLEFTAHHWREPNFDLWEEVLGDHFYTRMVQRKALVLGAEFARELGDHGAADWYASQAQALSAEIERHWNADLGLIMPTLNLRGGVDYKHSHLDTAVLLGALHGDAGDGFMTVHDPRIKATMDRIEGKFREIYPINHRPEIPGVAIGRYPEDKYAGNDFNGGNPWVLLTVAYAEAYYQMAQKTNDRELRTQHFQRAESFMERVRFHANPDGTLSEQMNRHTGFMMSAHDLTWNYSALLDALRFRVR